MTGDPTTVPHQVDVELTVQELERLSRAPFRRPLARILGAEPSPESVKAYAQKYPDRWGQLVAIFGRLSGYSEKVEVDAAFEHKIQTLSDMDLARQHAEIEGELRRMLGPGVPLDNISSDSPDDALRQPIDVTPVPAEAAGEPQQPTPRMSSVESECEAKPTPGGVGVIPRPAPAPGASGEFEDGGKGKGKGKD